MKTKADPAKLKAITMRMARIALILNGALEASPNNLPGVTAVQLDGEEIVLTTDAGQQVLWIAAERS